MQDLSRQAEMGKTCGKGQETEDRRKADRGQGGRTGWEQ